MKKLISKLKKIKDNAGSGLILVIVALGFIGILTGALLTAVGYVYRLKLYDYNARDNFYYVEQAMNEIYAGVGNKTVGCMQTAYNYTVDNMTYFDIKAGSNGAYVTKTNDEANLDFKKKFMSEVYSVFYGSATGSNEFVSSLAACITNDTVVLDDYEWDNGTRVDPVTGSMDYKFLKKKAGRSGITVLMYDKDGNILTGATEDDRLKLDRIVIKNIVLSRTADYNRSPASGTFTQTLAADIVIARPDFDVNFNSINADFNTLLDYSIIADMGVDINQYSKLSIQGNIYAASDYYNKLYNFYKTDYDPSNHNSDIFFEYDYTLDNYGNEVPVAGAYGGDTIIVSTELDEADNKYSEGSRQLVGPEDTRSADNKFCWKSIERLQKYKRDGSDNVIIDAEGNRQLVDSDTFAARYFMLPVTNKAITGFDGGNMTYDRNKVESGTGYTYFNSYLTSKGSSIVDAKYDGVNEHSKYSGLYINGTEVDLVSNMVIVPGSIAVMNSGSLSMYGIDSNKVVNSEVWTDNVVLGGYSLINPAKRDEVLGSSAIFNADLYVRDDLQLDADSSKFVLNGSYYGYGDSRKRDNRKFTAIVDPEAYHKATYAKDSYGNYICRDKDNTRVYEYIGDEDYSYASEGTTVTVKKGDYVYAPASALTDNRVSAQGYQKCTKVFRDLVDEAYSVVIDPNTGEELREERDVWNDTRGHYNSSAIVINGENSTLDLSKADNIFLAGRAYVELSKYTDVNSVSVNTYDDATKTSGSTFNANMRSYRYDAAVDDYRTGDSISVKPSQQAYMPPAFVGTPELTEYRINAGTADQYRHDYYKAELAYNITYDDSIFSDYFGYDDVNDKIFAPCYKVETFGKTYYYYDFEVAYDMMKNDINGIVYENNHDTDATNDINNADEMAEQFIVDYQQACKTDARLIPHLTKIDDQSETSAFKVGQISLPSNAADNQIYSSGAISAKNNTTFNIATSKSVTTSELDELLNRPASDPDVVTGQEAARYSGTISALSLSDSLLKKSNYVKFTLANISNNSAKAQLVDYIVGYHNEDNRTTNERILGIEGDDIDGWYDTRHSGIRGEAALTPINCYLNFFKIDSNKVIVPKGLGRKYAGMAEDAEFSNETSALVKEIDLGSGNDVYVTGQDITIYPKNADGKVKGIILAKGDVKFDKTVTSFEGLIVSGGKVYITDENNISTIKSNPEAVKAILNELQLVESSGTRAEAIYLKDSDGNYIDEDGNVLAEGEAPHIKYQQNEDGSYVTDENGQKVPETQDVVVGDATQKGLADEVLSLFKAYENTSTTASNTDDRSVNVYDLDYTSVMKYDNWVKNVE